MARAGPRACGPYPTTWSRTRGERHGRGDPGHQRRPGGPGQQLEPLRPAPLGRHRRALFENFARNGSFLQSERNDELRRKYNIWLHSELRHKYNVWLRSELRHKDNVWLRSELRHKYNVWFPSELCHKYNVWLH